MPATVVSIYPVTFCDPKPGLSPLGFEIPGSEDARTPTITHIPDTCIRTRNIPLEDNPGRDRIEIPVPAEEVARAIVWDHIRSSRLATESIYPGLFYVMRILNNVDEVERYCGAQLETVAQAQHGWFEALVREADDMWTRFRQFRVIDASHRMAAKHLDISREWSAAVVPQTLMTCPYCTMKIPEVAVICPHCQQVVNSARYAELKANL